MKSTLFAVLPFLFALTACGLGPDKAGDGPSKEEFDALQKRVVQLDRRVKQLEGRGRTPGQRPGRGGEGREGRGDPGNAQRVMVELGGDAFRVVLAAEGKRVRLPGRVPVGEYVLMAAFEEGEKPTRQGSVTVRAGRELSVTCDAAEQACTVD